MTSPAARTALLRTDSPIGRIALTGDGTAVTGLWIECLGELPHDGIPEARDPVLERADEQLAEYFAGRRLHFDVPVALAGTPFRQQVWARIAALPFAVTTSYGELGAAVGRPGAARAIGGAVGANPVPIIVPCHRVLGADGRITGYSAGDGAATKAMLLDHEGIPHVGAPVRTVRGGVPLTPVRPRPRRL